MTARAWLLDELADPPESVAPDDAPEVVAALARCQAAIRRRGFEPEVP
jgi:hypothetical protein